jgi:uncharacterized Rmd1/YagE family protein
MDKIPQSAAETEPAAPPMLVHALFLSDRLAVDRAQFADVISTTPFCFRADGGYGVIFRYGAVVLIGLSPEREKQLLSRYGPADQSASIEEERLELTIQPDKEEGMVESGVLQLKSFTPAHVLVLADILAKSVALARYEGDVAQVFDTIEPVASSLATAGRVPKARKALLQLIGAALLAQHRVSGRIAFAEKPDILWEHPDLERLYARLEDEYEIIERGTLLNGKVSVVAAAAQTFTDMMDTARSARLEVLIVILILAELVVAVIALIR